MPHLLHNPVCFACCLILAPFIQLSAWTESGTCDFNPAWQFSLGDHDGHAVSLPEFDADPSWTRLDLPHDWAISGPFDSNVDGYAGKLPWYGVGVYRKVFQLAPELSSHRVYFDFDGVMAHSRVFINGHLAGTWDYGYTAFRIDVTPWVHFGSDNVIAVEADTRKWGTRWYPGAGIYRNVRMILAEAVHFAQGETFVHTREDPTRRAIHQVYLDTIILHPSGYPGEIPLRLSVFDPEGTIIHRVSTHLTPADPETSQSTFSHQFPVASPRLWDTRDPALYRLELEVAGENSGPSTLSIPFGIRTLRLDPDDGLHLNGRRLQIKGVNLHHDLGPLGAAFNLRAAQRQLEIMKDMGVNALRTSHNPPAREVLDLCDRMGILVWVEVFDKWDETAGRHNGQPDLESFAHRHIRSTILRDRNHPCVFSWSVGNEILPGGENGVTPERTTMMASIVRKYDPTRAVSMGCHIPSMVEEPNFDALDMTGWNYARRYFPFRQKYPEKPILYSESASALSTRGHYELPLPTRPTDRSPSLQVCSYDLNCADWSDIADAEFALMEQDDYVGGEFVWTGFDYLGEPTPYSSDARSSYFGIVDLCGFPKDRFFLYRSTWNPEVTTVHILPHWNWPDRIGQHVPVFVYTNGDSAELFLNNKSLGMRRKGEVPTKATDLARGAKVTASSCAEGSHASAVTSPEPGTAWLAASGDPAPSLCIDLGGVSVLRFLELTFEREEKLYAYSIEAATTEGDWEPILNKVASETPQWGGPKVVYHPIELSTRFLRIRFGETREGAIPGLRSLRAWQEPVESDYYDVTYHYRLRWNDVTYMPGELKAVAYKDGAVIGESVIRTAEAPHSIRLTADRHVLDGSGTDLAFVTVEVLDPQGTPCPLASDLIFFDTGDLPIAGVGNGNPLSLEPFQAPFRHLFNGKALLILRAPKGTSGPHTVRASAPGLVPADLILQVE